MDHACEVTEWGTCDKNDGNEVVEDCDLPLELELTERIEVGDKTLPYVEVGWNDPEQTEFDKGVEPSFPLTMERRQQERKRQKEIQPGR